MVNITIMINLKTAWPTTTNHMHSRLYAIEDFHVTSYQANFASHHTSITMLVSSLQGAVLENTTKWPITFLFSSYYNIKLQLSDKNISTYTQ